MKAIVNNSTCRIVARELLTRGTVGKTMEAEFSADWDGLAITAVFEAGDVKADWIYTGEPIIIPHEVLVKAGVSVMLGFHGALPDGTIVKRTEKVWLNNVSETLDPAGVPSSEPTPDWTAQVQNIATEAKQVADSVRSDADAGKFNGQAGADGGYYTPAVTQPDENTMHVEFTPSKADMPAVDPTDITIPAGGGGGGSGEDGGYYTPAVTQTAENVMEISYAASKEGMPEVEAKEITLPAGPKGENFTYDDFTPEQLEELKGPAGDAATFEITETQTLEAGQPAAVTEVTGSTEQARKYKVSIPRGAKGDGGKSAYAYAVEGGYTGTEAEFAQKLAQEKYASPNALTFTGAVEGSYDGSEAVTVEIPSGGGGGGGKTLTLIAESQPTEEVWITITKGIDGNPISESELVITAKIKATDTNRDINIQAKNEAGSWMEVAAYGLKTGTSGMYHEHQIYSTGEYIIDRHSQSTGLGWTTSRTMYTRMCEFNGKICGIRSSQNAVPAGSVIKLYAWR